MLENGLDACNCKKKDCPRFGNCPECLRHHAENKKYPPYCKREAARAEKRAARKVEREERRAGKTKK